jgi:acetyl esterase/lipase
MLASLCFRAAAMKDWPSILKVPKFVIGWFLAALRASWSNIVVLLGGTDERAFRERLYPRQDALDELSCRPDFAVAVYPGHLALWPPSLRLNPDIAKRISPDTPPTFLLQNEDDDVDNVDDALSYYTGLRNARVPTEMHLYPHGGHAYGLRLTDQPVTAWPSLLETWFKTLGILPR